jgi:hypothetical protein
MSKQTLSILTILILTATTCYSQNFEPLDLAKQIFAKDSLSNIDKYVTGEYTGRPNGQDLQPGSTTNFLLLGQTDTKAVVAITILDSTGKGLDTYLHFVKDKIWKATAFRALALTGIIEQVKNELEKMTPEQVDDIIKSSKKNKKSNKFAMFTSKEDYEFELGNAKLTLELDQKIIEHFTKNKTEFERIKDSVLAELQKTKIDEERDTKVGENLKADYRNLFISSIFFGGYEFGKCINFVIGGMVDNSVGYLFIKDKKDIPEMSSYRIIMLREIGDGWYIYKTT